MHHALVADSTADFRRISTLGQDQAHLLSRNRHDTAGLLEEQCRTLERLIGRSATAPRETGPWRDATLEKTYRAACRQLREQREQAAIVLTSAAHLLQDLRRDDSA